MSTNVHLTPELERFARQCVESGRYNNVSEVVRDGLRLLEERETRLAALRQEIEAGRASGEPVAFDPEDVKRRGRAALSRAGKAAE